MSTLTFTDPLIRKFFGVGAGYYGSLAAGCAFLCVETANKLVHELRNNNTDLKTAAVIFEFFGSLGFGFLTYYAGSVAITCGKIAAFGVAPLVSLVPLCLGIGCLGAGVLLILKYPALDTRVV